MSQEMSLSPNTMAQAAFAEGIEGRKRRDTANKTAMENNRSVDATIDFTKDDDPTGTSRNGFDAIISALENNPQECSNASVENDMDRDFTVNKRQRLMEASDDEKNGKECLPLTKLENIWNFLSSEQTAVSFTQDNSDGEISCDSEDDPIKKADIALEQTLKLLMTELDVMIQQGTDAFEQNDTLMRKVARLKDLNEKKEREIQRLRASEADSRSSLKTLLEAVEVSKAKAHNAALAAKTETSLRSEISKLKLEKEKVNENLTDAQRKMSLLGEEVSLLNSRVERLTQEKIKVERDSRAAMSLARSMDSHASSDVQYYKKKVLELNTHLHARNTQIAELKEKLYECEAQKIGAGQNRLISSRSS